MSFVSLCILALMDKVKTHYTKTLESCLRRRFVSAAVGALTMAVHQHIVKALLGRNGFPAVTDNVMRSSCGEGKHFFGPKPELRRRDLSILGLQEDHEDLLVHCVGEQGLLALLGRQRQEVVLC